MRPCLVCLLCAARASSPADALCGEFIFRREVLEQIQEADIINERKGDGEVGERGTRKALLRESERAGGRDGGDECHSSTAAY